MNSTFFLSVELLFRTMLTRLSLYLLALFSPASGDSIHQRTYFYVGGNYSVTENGEHVYTNQIYVEKLTPVQVTQPYPIVFIHGQAQTATVGQPRLSWRNGINRAWTELVEQARRPARMGIVLP